MVAAVEARTGRGAVVSDTTPEAARAALAEARSASLVVAIGGDGTIRDVAEPLMRSGVPIAIVPAGTGNVFASAVGVPRRLPAAIRLIETGRPESVDVGVASWGSAGAHEPDGSRSFVVACGLGFDARVMAGATTDLKRRFGFGAYVMSTAREAARVRPVRFRIEADDRTYEVGGVVVMLANCGQLLPGLVGPRRPFDPSDGLLDVVVIRGTGATGGLAGVAEVLLATHDPPHHRRRSMRLRARHVRVTSEPPEPVQVDGDHHEADWLSAVSEPGALTVIRP